MTLDAVAMPANPPGVTMKLESGTVVAILPCNDLDASESFYARVGFTRTNAPTPGEPDTYRMLSNGTSRLHLTDAVFGWLIPGKNPFGLCFYMEDVDRWAAEFRAEIIGKDAPNHKPWGTDEFAVSDPDETLVRVGWPTRLHKVKTESKTAYKTKPKTGT